MIKSYAYHAKNSDITQAKKQVASFKNYIKPLKQSDKNRANKLFYNLLKE